MKTLIAKIKYHARTLAIIMFLAGCGIAVVVAMKWADYKKVTE